MTDIHEDWLPEVSEDCKICGEELQWNECTECEDGYYDAYEEDPLWYEPGEVKPCPTCKGKGGWNVCWNQERHPK